MGRRPERSLLRDKRRHLAAMIDAALENGQRGDGRTPERHWIPWTNEGFGAAASASEGAVRGWRDRDDPTRPVNIIPILKVFYGDLPQFAEARGAMLRAWREAGGLDADGPPDPRTIKVTAFSEVAHVVSLAVNQATPDNQGNLKVPFILRFRHVRNQKVAILRGGKVTEVGIDIGLRRPLFDIRSSHWQPLRDAIVRKGAHECTEEGPWLDSVFLVKKTDKDGVIVGEPLEDLPDIVLERMGQNGDGPFTFSVLVDRDGFRIAPAGGAEVDAVKRAVLDAIFASAIPKDRDGMLVVAQVEATPGVPPREPA